MSPVPSLGRISFTKFTSPEAVTQVLSSIVPGKTTAAEVSQALESAGQPGPLWNDLMAYSPAVLGENDAAGQQVCVDNELLRASREGREDRFLLLWVALNLADPRLDDIVRNVLTREGHLVPAMVNGQQLLAELQHRASSPSDPKSTSNILSLLERCRLIVPSKRGKTIWGIDRELPTRHAVPAAVRLIAERLADRGLVAVPGGEVDLALGVGANSWLNLSHGEFREAHASRTTPEQQSQRDPLPAGLVELASQLRRKGQVVLQGPPGAGKTYVAKRYVEWSTAGRTEESRLQAIVGSLPAHERTVEGITAEIQRRGLVTLWDLVQFHPGYDYTDFVRALVAEPHGEGVTFVARHRILSLISAVGVELEKRDTDVELVLILDEINRGDIPNIFGELLYGLEYRGEAVATPYSIRGDASLTIPRTLRVIGTMNTADRSIAVIDYALRRRFVFLEVAADDSPIRDFPYSDESAKQAALYLYARTADALEKAPAGLQVGPSYFMAHADGDSPEIEVLASRYVYEVLPLLAEYEMEGEVGGGVVTELCQSLGVDHGSAQHEQVQALLSKLSAHPWATPSAAGESDQPL